MSSSSATKNRAPFAGADDELVTGDRPEDGPPGWVSKSGAVVSTPEYSKMATVASLFTLTVNVPVAFTFLA